MDTDTDTATAGEHPCTVLPGVGLSAMPLARYSVVVYCWTCVDFCVC